MAEPLKEVYNETFLRSFGAKLRTASRSFDAEQFVQNVLDKPWDELELKQRMRKITETLGGFLPGRYEDAIRILLDVHESCKGFPYLILPDFVEVFGLGEEHWELSIQALERFTSGSSSEFAVRPFILRDPERMMRQMLAWTEHPDEHVRRLASEGCRPRLPWGRSLPMFKKDPTPIIPVLERLKRDPSLYVRKSVANNLNDIAKDHPALVAEIAAQWKGSHAYTDWIVRHGCRTLIRNADPAVLKLFGYSASEDAEGKIAIYANLSAEPRKVPIGGGCELSYEVHVRDGEPAKLRIEYGVDFVKAKGQTSRKLFLLSDKTVAGGMRLNGKRTHSWADLTTRRHYPGEHRICLLINGREVSHTTITLTSPQS